MTDRPRIPLEDLLLRHGAISPEQLAEARTLQQKTGRELAQILLQLGYVSEQTLNELVSRPTSPATELEVPKTLEAIAERLVALEQTVRPLRDELTASMAKHPQFAAINARLERLEQLAHNEVNAVKALTEMLIDRGVIDRETFFIKISRH
jgi:hypothetical protein